MSGSSATVGACHERTSGGNRARQRDRFGVDADGSRYVINPEDDYRLVAARPRDAERQELRLRLSGLELRAGTRRGLTGEGLARILRRVHPLVAYG